MYVYTHILYVPEYNCNYRLSIYIKSFYSKNSKIKFQKARHKAAMLQFHTFMGNILQQWPLQKLPKDVIAGNRTVVLHFHAQHILCRNLNFVIMCFF